MMLEYNREYRTYFHISQSYQVSEPTAYRLISRAENLLIKSGKLSLSGKKALLGSQIYYEAIIIDATELKIERSKNQKSYYSAKKKYHHLKAQAIIDKATG